MKHNRHSSSIINRILSSSNSSLGKKSQHSKSKTVSNLSFNSSKDVSVESLKRNTDNNNQVKEIIRDSNEVLNDLNESSLLKRAYRQETISEENEKGNAMGMAVNDVSNNSDIKGNLINLNINRELNKNSSTRSSISSGGRKEHELISQIIRSEKKEYDNDYETNEYFLKLKLEDFNCAYFTLCSIVNGLIHHDTSHFPIKNGISVKNPQFYDLTLTFTLIMTSVFSFFFILSSLNRYMILLSIAKSSSEVNKKKTFWNFEYFGWFFIELLFSLIHPNLIFKNTTFSTNPEFYMIETTYDLNDILCVITMLRVYVIFRFFITSSYFYTVRTTRIAKMIGNHLNRLFVIRCIVLMHPYLFLLVTMCILVSVTSYILKISEGPAYHEALGENDYSRLINCIWNVFVTMTTVGYGDYYPITNLGRINNIFVCICGIWLNSFMVTALQNFIVFTENEEKAFLFKEKNIVKERTEKRAAQYFRAAFDYVKKRNNYRKALQKGLPKEQLRTLKKMVHQSFYDKFFAKKSFKKIFQFYRNTYQVLTESDLLREKMDSFQSELIDMDETNDSMEHQLNLIENSLTKIEKLAPHFN